MLTVLVGVKWCLTVGFNCISLMTNVEHCSPVCNESFSLVVFEDFLWFQISILHCLGVVFFVFILLGVH